MGQEVANDGANLVATTQAHQHEPGVPCQCEKDFIGFLPILAVILIALLIFDRLRSRFRKERKGEDRSSPITKENEDG